MSGNKKYYWLKLKDDFFTQKEIKRLRRLAGGDTYTIIYLKLLLLSLNNEGKIYFDDIGDNLADELSLEIDEEADNIKMTLNYLQQKGLLELINQDEIYLNEVKTMLGSESESAERVRNYRRKLKQEKLQCNVNALPSNNEETKSNTEIEIEKERELEKKNKKEINIDADKSAETPTKSIHIKKIFELYNSICSDLPRATVLSSNRQKAIRIIYTKFPDIEKIQEVFIKANESDFLKGINNRNWKADIDWLLKEANFVKVLENKYENKDGGGNGNSKPSENNTEGKGKWAGYKPREIEFTEEEYRELANVDVF